MSAFDASATSPSNSSVAGLMLVNVQAWPSTRLPSISIRDSNFTLGRSAMLLLECTVAREAHRQTDQVMKQPRGQQAAAEQHQARVEADRVPRERGPLVENPGEPPREP